MLNMMARTELFVTIRLVTKNAGSRACSKALGETQHKSDVAFDNYM